MASLISGFEYDIFISYRQKDNKYDGWVTEFVDNLKKELEATFKENISVYFDINPHDGLLETHDVDASLKDKLKCLIFIPIISRTYCDPKSFAWEHEFMAFIEQASRDQIGLKVKLAGGNVSNRVLPVQIHNLEADDKKLVESELGGFLRGIEFIYKEPGVNRPLMSNEDHPDNNLNKTFYRNQINKVANAIEEIITSIKKYGKQDEIVSEEVIKTKPQTPFKLKPKIVIGSILILALIVLGYFYIPKLFQSSEQVEKSIAVLPFKSLSDDPEKQYLADGVMDAILLHLSKIEDLRVMSRTSVEQYRKTDKTLNVIGKELDVAYLLEGSFQKYGDNARLIVQLIKTGKEGHEWANKYDRNWNDIFAVQSEIAQVVAHELNAVITPDEKQLIEKIPTINLTAYDFWQRGEAEYQKVLINKNDIDAFNKAEDLFVKALESDSSFAEAYVSLAGIIAWKPYSNKSDRYDSLFHLLNLALSYDNKLSSAYQHRGIFYMHSGKPEKAIYEYNKAIKYNPNYYPAYLQKAWWNVNYANDYVEAIDNFLKASKLHRGSRLPYILRSIAFSLDVSGFPDKARFYMKEALTLDHDSTDWYRWLATSQQGYGNYLNAIELWEKAYSIDTIMNECLREIGMNFAFLGQYNESLDAYENYFKRSSSKFRSHHVGYAYSQVGNKEKSEFYLNDHISYYNYLNETQSYEATILATYQYLASLYAFKGNKEKAYENLMFATQKDRFPIYFLNELKDDPMFNKMRHEPEFQNILKEVEAKYKAEHERVREWLEKQGNL